MQNLPINEVLPEIQHALNTHHRVVLQAPPGAGKTTAVPIALLDQPWLRNRKIIMLEPRRLAARNAAARMAWLLGEKLGQRVGYQIRQDSCLSEQTKILVVTEGILTRKLQADPELQDAALVIFDEFHERSLHADLSLALCLQSQQVLREDLKILVMSATLHTDAIAHMLDNGLTGDSPTPVIESQGRSYPVDIHYLDKAIKPNDTAQLMSSLMNTVKSVIQHHKGNCLVFLPGVREINQLADQIRYYLNAEAISDILLSPLHGNLSKQQQDQAIAVPAAGQRKIVLATNIAETSITIDGIDCVIDSGLERILEYSPASGMNRLKTQPISQDSAEQRSGRAGRLSAGVCYRLWTAQQQSRLQKHAIAEILHSDLSTLMLELANWGVQQADELHWLDIPPASAIEQAKTLLQQLGAIDSKNRISQHGRDMLRLGAHPRLAHMMLSAIKLQQGYHACLIASILTEKDIFLSAAEKSSDIHDRLNILQQLRSAKQIHDNKIQDHSIDLAQCRRIIQSADDFYKRLGQCTDRSSGNWDNNAIDHHLSGVLLAYAYPDRIAKQRNRNEPRYLLSNGKGAMIPAHLQQHLPEFLVIANLDANFDAMRSQASIYLAADISEQQLQDYFSDHIQYTEITEWNAEQQRVEAKKAAAIGKIILQQSLTTPEDKTAVHLCLLRAIKNIGLQCLDWTPQAENLKQRLQFIHDQLANNPDLKEKLAVSALPDFSDEMLLATLDDWLLPHLTTENSIKQCQKLDLYNILSSRLDWNQQQLVNSLAPEKITVPSGSAIRIDYSDAAKPVLAVRLQEVFGLNETPAILHGHVRLMMHLLSPAHRPMQVTQDLNSFWQTTYHEVKKELRGKYKRHYWPDDPFTAQATSKTKKQMNK